MAKTSRRSSAQKKSIKFCSVQQGDHGGQPDQPGHEDDGTGHGEVLGSHQQVQDGLKVEANAYSQCWKWFQGFFKIKNLQDFSSHLLICLGLNQGQQIPTNSKWPKIKWAPRVPPSTSDTSICGGMLRRMATKFVISMWTFI